MEYIICRICGIPIFQDLLGRWICLNCKRKDVYLHDFWDGIEKSEQNLSKAE